eukprot:g83300.t1
MTSNRTAVIVQDGRFTASGWLLHVGSSVTSVVGHTGTTKTFDSRQCMRRASQDMMHDRLVCFLLAGSNSRLAGRGIVTASPLHTPPVACSPVST